jgi:hypothetical protein
LEWKRKYSEKDECRKKINGVGNPYQYCWDAHIILYQDDKKGKLDHLYECYEYRSVPLEKYYEYRCDKESPRDSWNLTIR